MAASTLTSPCAELTSRVSSPSRARRSVMLGSPDIAARHDHDAAKAAGANAGEPCADAGPGPAPLRCDPVDTAATLHLFGCNFEPGFPLDLHGKKGAARVG